MLFVKIIHFLRDVVYKEVNDKLTFVKKIVNILIMISWIYAISLVTFVPISIIFGSGTKNLIDNFVSNTPQALVFLFIVLLAPFIEELTFRWPLRFNKFSLPISFFLLTEVFLTSIIPFPGGDSLIGRVYLGVVICISVLIFILSIKYKTLISHIYSAYFRYILYTSILTFAIIHFTNYTSFNGVPFFVIPIFVLPQLVTGIVISYVRMTYGFWYGFVTHMLYNLILTLVSIPTLGIFKDPVYLVFFIISFFGFLSLSTEIFKLLASRNS